MFFWLNNQGVQSDQGFIVQRTGRFTAEYRESTKRMTVNIESGLTGGKPSIIVDPHAFERWDGDPEGPCLPPEKQAQILKNFRAAMEFQGLVLSVE